MRFSKTLRICSVAGTAVETTWSRLEGSCGYATVSSSRLPGEDPPPPQPDTATAKAAVTASAITRVRFMMLHSSTSSSIQSQTPELLESNQVHLYIGQDGATCGRCSLCSSSAYRLWRTTASRLTESGQLK